jgi:outer membrane receptor protein involved in Fe transport
LVTARPCWPIWRRSWRLPIGWKAIAYGSALALAAEFATPPASAQPGDIKYQIDIPAGPASESLSALSAATGISVGMAGGLPQFQTRSLHAKTSASEALRKLLAGSGFQAVQVGPLAFRIEREPPAAEKPHRPRPALPATSPQRPTVTAPEDIIVTAQKRRQSFGQVPMSLSILGFAGAADGGVTAGSHDVEKSVEGFALTNLGPGRNRLFIRGVADSPFDGVSQSTVAVQVDDARVIFDAPDPDLRLVDMERVEVLKGPQGPLYGSGALGGIYHLVTQKPALDKPSVASRLLVETVQHGSAGIGGETVLNLPLVTDRLALRIVGYGLRGGGWIDNIGGKQDANSSVTLGGRVTLRWQPSPDWTVDVGGIAQYLNVADSQYVTGSRHTLRRGPQIPEPVNNDFREGHTTIEGRIGDLRLVSATSYIDHDVHYTLDATDAAARFGLTGQTRFRDDRNYTIINQELRVSPDRGGRWLAGVSYMRAHSHSVGVMSDAAGDSLQVQSLDRVVTEYALFGEATLPLSQHLSATAGARIYRTVAENEAHSAVAGRANRIANTAVSPAIALSWTASGSDSIYLRYARALRPGGLAAARQIGGRRFDSDELGTVDLGIRHHPAGGHLSFIGSLYYTVWDHIQSDFLLPNGLISTRNAGSGRIIGGELSATWQATHNVKLTAGVNLQDARLTHTEQGVEVHDLRLPVAPAVTARVAIQHDFHLGPWTASLAAQGNYFGSARLALDEQLDRKMGDYSIFTANASFTRDRLTLAARIDNLADVKGDSFAFGNPFSIMNGRQYTPLRPRTLTFSIGRRW